MTLRTEIAADVHYALRSFSRSPGLTLITVLTLAIGLGATTAIFSVVDAVLLRPLPYAQADRLVQIVENVPAEEGFGGVAVRRTAMNLTDFEWWRKNSKTLSHVGLIQRDARVLATPEGSVQLYGARVSPALFFMRGIAPLQGRGLLPDDERPDTDVMVVSESMWRRYLNSDPSIVGRRVELDGRAHTVVGVMPTVFGDEAFWTPYVPPPAGPGFFFLPAQARLADGVTLAAASAEANTLGMQMRGKEPKLGAAPRFEMVRNLDQMTAAVAPALRVLTVAVAVVLAIVCTNVANLMLVRGTRRHLEIAIRRSLGATRARIVRQVLTESIVLAGCAGLAAIALAFAGVALLKSTAVGYVSPRFPLAVGSVLPRIDEISIDPMVLAFVVVASAVTGVLFGLLPALRLSKYGERGHASAAQMSAHAGNTRLGHALAAVQLAFAMALLIGAALLVHSFLKVTGLDTGFDTSGALAFDLVVPGDSTAERKLEVAETLAARLTSDPRITAAGFSEAPPLLPSFVFVSANIVPEGKTDADMREEQRTQTMTEIAQTRQMSPAYLRALGAHLVAGSWLDERTEPGPAALVTKAYAERYFPGRSAVGATLRVNGVTVTVAGVVGDVHLGALEQAPERAVFLDARQIIESLRAGAPRSPQTDRFFLTTGGTGIAFAARTKGDPLAIMADLRTIVRDIDPRLAIDAAVPLERIVSGLTTRPRFYAALLSVFGAIAGFIAVIGIYGVLSYVVSQRTKEIGVRMALGAQRSEVLALVLRRGALIVGIGVASGVAAAMALTGYLQGMLFGLKALDVGTFATVAVAFAAIAMLAVYLPARRATSIDPLQALRQD